MMRKSAWLLSAGLTILATPAIAQTATSNTDTDKQTAQPTQGATSEAAAVQDKAREQQPVDTSDIVITATRRNEALSDVPMAVSAVTAQTLEYTGATDIRQLNQVAPSLQVFSTSSEAGAARANIRGIGTVGDNPGLESSVGVFIDGVYRSRTGVGLTELGAIDRIEVLRGPQGTLFGRNTSAGLISVITAKPRFTPEVFGQVDIGNYDSRRLEVGATGGLTDTIAARVDAVYFKRDGFLKDVISGRRVNDRDRAMIRGQVLYQPSDNFSFRLIGDYAKRREECCAATYLPAHDVVRVIAPPAGVAADQPSTIAGIERALGGIIRDDTFSRRVSITPGRDFDSRVNDGGVSGEGVYDFGWGELTSITAWRYNKYTRGQDADFNNLDILYRDSNGDSFNRFKTFTQELRLQGNAFNNRLDWLVGAYYANENLRVDDNLAYGSDYERYTNCLVLAANLPSALAPTPDPNGFCVNVTAVQTAIAALPPGNPTRALLQAFIANPARPGFGSIAAALGIPAFDQADVRIDDSWKQKSDNWALFTHNIFSITETLKLTAGLRFTHEKKKVSGDLNDNNELCVRVSQFISPLSQLPCVIPGIPGGHLDIDDSKSESKLSGTGVISWKPTPRILTYASYSRGYKAGGFNLDRSALARAASTAFNGLSGPGAICISANQGNCQGLIASGADLEFKPETNDAFELGLKYNGPGFDFNVAAFHQVFRNFQLNTFNGLNFFVENINGCSHLIPNDDADTDNDPTTGVCDGKKKAGVVSKGLEFELYTHPLPNVAVNAGAVYADVKYRDNLVGANGRALTNALFQLPGRQVSGAPKWTLTNSIAWTPPIGGTGLRGLVYLDSRYMSKYNTGSDLDVEKVDNGSFVVNGRVGIHGPRDQWAFEVWGQNLFDVNYLQVGFDAPVQGTGTRRGVEQGFYPRATQLYGAFLAEPRTFGVTLRGKLDFAREPAPAYTPPLPPPPPAAEPAPPPPPPPPPPPAPSGERGE